MTARAAGRSPRWRWAALGATWLVVVLAGGWLVNNSQTDREQGLEQRFAARAQTGAGFVQSYTHDVLTREHLLAERTLRSNMSAAAFGALVQDEDLQAAVLLDAHGRLLVAYPDDPALVGVDIGARYAHLRGALAGVPTVSGVVASAVRHTPVVAFAVPFDSPSGRRVFSGGYAVSGTPLRPYLVNEVGQFSGEAYLIDAAGLVAASGRAGPDQPGLLSHVAPQLAAAALHPGHREVGSGASQQLVVTVAVPSTPWRLVFAAPTRLLYQTAGGPARWAAWIVLLALALAILIAIALFERTVRQRSRLAEQQVRSQDQLRQSESMFRSAFDDALLGMCLTGLDGRLIRVNQVFADLVGRSPEELVGTPIETFSRPSDRHRNRPEVGRTLAGEIDGFRSQGCYVRDGGSEVWADVSTSLVRDAAGAPVHFVTQLIDITDQRQAAAAVARARDEALAATAAKSAFLATMSHEIRTPMNAVIGMTGLLLDTDLDATQRDYTETVRTSGDALLGIINNVLDYSKIESGKLDLELLPFDLEDLVEGAVELASVHAGAERLDILADIDAGCPRRVVGDVTRVRQVLVNLLANAVKFTSEGEVMVSVETMESAENGLELHVAVADTGIGIPPDRMDRLFRSFSQVEASTTRTYGGSGLGLAISARLVDAMGGRIGVESEPGNGSTFHFAIPVTQPDGSSPAETQADDLRGRHALVVDDNADGRRILQRRLGRWGVTSDGAASGAAALGLARTAGERRYDLAIVDRELPDMSGAGLADALHAVARYGDLPLVLLASRQSGDEGDDGARFVATLAKPTRSAHLHSAVTSAVDGQQAPPRRHRDARSDDAPSALRILLAEDNAVNQKVALLMLRRLGYRADVAGNGLEAIAALERAHYEVVLMDVQMPEMDGLQATARIRSELAAERQPVIIAMTANAMTEDRTSCQAAGMDGYMTKPFRMEDLAAALEQCVVDAPARAMANGAAGLQPSGDNGVGSARR